MLFCCSITEKVYGTTLHHFSVGCWQNRKVEKGLVGRPCEELLLLLLYVSCLLVQWNFQGCRPEESGPTRSYFHSLTWKCSSHSVICWSSGMVKDLAIKNSRVCVLCGILWTYPIAKANTARHRRPPLQQVPRWPWKWQQTAPVVATSPSNVAQRPLAASTVCASCDPSNRCTEVFGWRMACVLKIKVLLSLSRLFFCD